jgi:hypothetical protein
MDFLVFLLGLPLAPEGWAATPSPACASRFVWITCPTAINQLPAMLRIRIWILLSACKNSTKNLDSYYFVTLFNFLSLKKDVNVP